MIANKKPAIEKPLYLIEVWRNPDGEKWIAECTTKEQCKFSSWWYAQSYYCKAGWPYWYRFDGKSAVAIVACGDLFTRGEALEISGLVISGKGVKAWSINLTEI